MKGKYLNKFISKLTDEQYDEANTVTECIQKLDKIIPCTFNVIRFSISMDVNVPSEIYLNGENIPVVLDESNDLLRTYKVTISGEDFTKLMESLRTAPLLFHELHNWGFLVYEYDANFTGLRGKCGGATYSIVCSD